MISAFNHDRIMSMHRRAYQVAREDGTGRGGCEAWWELAKKLDCPKLAIDQIWKTATMALEAGMTMELAFPLSGRLDQECSPIKS